MNLIQQSYHRLFPDKLFPYQSFLNYNKKLGDFNANIRLKHQVLEIRMNSKWKDIDDEIKIGLIQHLLLKILKNKQTTSNIELYHSFVKNIPVLTPKNNIDGQLLDSFSRVNEQLLSGQLELPNLQWGQETFRKLAHYNYHNDTITMSSLFKDASNEIIDYIMYHEMLHKHLQFTSKNGRSSYHTPQFKRMERMYPNHSLIEKRITGIVRQKKGMTKRRPKQKTWLQSFLRKI
ncbi:MAG: hypothetical protein CMH61_01610 [Nanoarchaeota archaeon]|nr:hypothetical protein [Nanoarchaeota archaeon]|tara:strand:- start:1886 stop:2584 length:699 start_codon:yes stop_codon:yes gene_type:complete